MSCRKYWFLNPSQKRILSRRLKVPLYPHHTSCTHKKRLDVVEEGDILSDFGTIIGESSWLIYYILQNVFDSFFCITVLVSNHWGQATTLTKLFLALCILWLCLNDRICVILDQLVIFIQHFKDQKHRRNKIDKQNVNK